MKKVYAASLALAVAMMANAAPIDKSVKLETKPATMMQANPNEVVTPSAVKPIAATTPKAINSIDDLVGLKTWSCVGHLGEEGDEKRGPREQACYFSKQDATTILMNDFPWQGKETKMLVNISAKTVTIMNNQQVGENGSGGEMVYLYTYEVTVGADGKYNRVSKPSVRGTIQEDGTIVFPENVWIGASDPTNEPNGRFFYLDSDNVFSYRPYNTPVADEYETIGTATFTDGWFNALLLVDGMDPIVDTEVEVVRNKTNKNLVALKNPYNNPDWVNVFGAELTDNGYILLDLTHKDWLQVMPLVQCNLEVENQDGSITEFFPFNEEGYYVWSGADWQGVKEEWELFEEPISNIDENGIATIYHLYFGQSGAPLGFYWWTAWPDGEVKTATIELPAGTMGIEGVATDMVEGPVKYYNLQGVEIAAPVKGQLTIKKQGNKSVKFIAR